MSRTSSVLTTDAARAGFGAFLRWALRLGGHDEVWLEEQFHAGAVSRHERRPTDVKKYLNGKKTPDVANLELLRRILDIPRAAMLTAAGYIDVVLSTLAAASHQNEAADWEWDQRPREAALERLLSLFPNPQMDPGLSQTASLDWIVEKVGRLNIMDETERLHKLWPFWVWVMPRVFERKHFVHHEQRDIRASFSERGSTDSSTLPPIVYRAIRAERQFSLADATSEDLFLKFYAEDFGVSDDLLSKALACLKDKTQAWSNRVRLAAHYVHQWADEKYCEQADNIRGRLRAIHERVISEEEELSSLGMIGLSEAEGKPAAVKRQPQFE